MSGERPARSIGNTSSAAKVSAARGAVHTTLGVAPFVAALNSLDAPLIVDLGPAVGGNVEFLGEELGCKLVVEDLLENLPMPPEPVEGEDPPEEPLPRLSHPDSSVDGLLCWDVLDYLSPESRPGAGQAELVRVLKPRGALLLSHGAESLSQPGRVEYEIINETSLRYRLRSGATPRARRVLQSREVTQMFDSLAISDSFLLKSQMREVLFRKPAAPAAED